MLPGCERLDRRGGRRGRAGRCAEVAGWTAVAVAGLSLFPPRRGVLFYSSRAAARGASCLDVRSLFAFPFVFQRVPTYSHLQTGRANVRSLRCLAYRVHSRPRLSGGSCLPPGGEQSGAVPGGSGHL